MQYLRRQHFNQWYRLGSWFMALLTAQLPIVFIMTTVCSLLIYFLTSQPLELFRFVLFLVIMLLTTLIGIAYGIFMGSRMRLLVSTNVWQCNNQNIIDRLSNHQFLSLCRMPCSWDPMYLPFGLCLQIKASMCPICHFSNASLCTAVLCDTPWKDSLPPYTNTIGQTWYVHGPNCFVTLKSLL